MPTHKSAKKNRRYMHDLRRECSWREPAVGNQHRDADVTCRIGKTFSLIPRDRACIWQIYLRNLSVKVVCWTGLPDVDLRLFLNSLYRLFNEKGKFTKWSSRKGRCRKTVNVPNHLGHSCEYIEFQCFHIIVLSV